VEICSQFGMGPGDAIWGTSAGRQLSSLQREGWETCVVPLCEPRDLWALVRACPEAFRILRAMRPSGIVSTGSAVAFPFALASRLLGIPFSFIESLTRVSGPSRTGTLIELLPGVDLRTQVLPWSRRRGPLVRTWARTVSTLDGFERIDRESNGALRRVFVATGIMTREYPFDRLFEKLESIVPDGVEIRVQGAGNWKSSKLTLLSDLSPDALAQEIDAADAVVIHAGVGLALDCMAIGKHPVVVPRESRHREHVDDHQGEFASELANRLLATVRFVDALQWRDIQESTRSAIRRVNRSCDIRYEPLGALARSQET
jgi:UDP-N-acetylglucosamine--N-acetylmuramyl-(pentapeptide) pyrophosphoryl-undecaprenol N-acetylglucosamine transferase